MNDANASGEWIARIGSWDLTAPGSEVTFEEKLAREQGWTLGRANVAVHEYRRFLVLTRVAGHPVCPSPDVDAAWHQHLTETRRYRAFCQDVLGGFLHHEPSREGPAELARHRQMYAETLDAYRAVFLAPAPADAWPPVEARFSRLRTAGPRRAFTLPSTLASGWARAVLVVLAVAGVAWLARPVAQEFRDVPAWLCLLVYIACLLVAFAITWEGAVTTSDGGAPGSVDAFEAAWLAGGSSRVVAAAVGGLIDRGAFRLEAERRGGKLAGATLVRVEGWSAAGPLDPLERAALAATRPGPVDAGQLARDLAPQLDRIGARLESARLLVPARQMPAHQLMRLALLVLLCGVGVARLTLGFDRSSTFAVVMFAKVQVYTVLALVFLSAAPQRVSALGTSVAEGLDGAMAWLKERAGAPRSSLASPADGERAPKELPASFGPVCRTTLAVALFGSAAVIQDPAYAGFNLLFAGNGKVVTGGSGGDAGCEGGGCSGCGGCG